MDVLELFRLTIMLKLNDLFRVKKLEVEQFQGVQSYSGVALRLLPAIHMLQVLDFVLGQSFCFGPPFFLRY